MYDIEEVRKDFPILGREVYGRPLVYLDNAATVQKPRCVVEAMADEYYNVNANVHRGVHFLSQQATELHEAARETVRRFLNARSTAEGKTGWFTALGKPWASRATPQRGAYRTPSFPAASGRKLPV